MPSGRRVKFNLRLQLDREGRRLLDLYLARANQIRKIVQIDAQHQIMDGIRLIPEEMVMKAMKSHGIDEQLAAHLCKEAAERAAAHVLADYSRKYGRDQTLVFVPFSELVFSTSERAVRIPPIGVCRYIANRFVIDDSHVVSLRQLPIVARIGYKNNDPTLQVDTEEKPAKPAEDFSGQKLIKLSRRKAETP